MIFYYVNKFIKFLIDTSFYILKICEKIFESRNNDYKILFKYIHCIQITRKNSLLISFHSGYPNFRIFC